MQPPSPRDSTSIKLLLRLLVHFTFRVTTLWTSSRSKVNSTMCRLAFRRSLHAVRSFGTERWEQLHDLLAFSARRTVERSAVYPVYDARDVYSCVAVPGLPFFFSSFFRSSLPVQQKRTPTLDTALREQKKPSAKSFSVSAFTPTRLPRSFSFFFVFVGSGGTLDSVVCKHDETRFRRGSRPCDGTKGKCFFFPLGRGEGGFLFSELIRRQFVNSR